MELFDHLRQLIENGCHVENLTDDDLILLKSDFFKDNVTVTDEDIPNIFNDSKETI